jgi:Zn-finger nucleic acid-binding protein
MMFLGQKFCGHCGARADRIEAEEVSQCCPRCRLAMEAVPVGGTSLLECGRCGGLWVENGALEEIYRDREKQALVSGMGVPAGETAVRIEPVRYVPCPACAKLMNRVNFANCSNVVVDVCKSHGTWFDRDELRRVVEFIRAGGLEAARTRQLAEIEAQRRRLAAEKLTTAFDTSSGRGALDYSERRSGISLVGGLLRACVDRLGD